MARGAVLRRRTRWLALLAVLLALETGIVATLALAGWFKPPSPADALDEHVIAPASAAALREPDVPVIAPASAAALHEPDVAVADEPGTIAGATVAELQPGAAPTAAKPVRPAGEPITRRRPPKPNVPTLIEVQVTSEPPGAMVSVGKGKYGQTPLTVYVDPGQRTVLTLTMPGYQDKHLLWAPKSHPTSLHADLTRQEAP